MKTSLQVQKTFNFKKFAILKLCLFCSIATAYTAEYYKAKLFYTSGHIIDGLAEYPADKSVNIINYKEVTTAQNQRINSSDLNKVIYYNEGDTVIFEQISFKSMVNETKIKGPIWMEKLIDGYATVYVYSEAELVMHTSNKIIANTPERIYYACIRVGEQSATVISFHASDHAINNNGWFRKKAAKYFSDYPELSAKIANKEYTFKDIDKVMDEYNKWAQK